MPEISSSSFSPFSCLLVNLCIYSQVVTSQDIFWHQITSARHLDFNFFYSYEVRFQKFAWHFLWKHPAINWKWCEEAPPESRAGCGDLEVANKVGLESTWLLLLYERRVWVCHRPVVALLGPLFWWGQWSAAALEERVAALYHFIYRRQTRWSVVKVQMESHRSRREAQRC